MIEVKNLCKTFNQHRVLDDISFHIRSGDIFGLIGKSGAGKSTLLRCLNLLERPDAGEITIEGQHLLRLGPARLRQVRHKIGMVFQHYNLLASKTAFENIALPLRVLGQKEKVITARVTDLLNVVELPDKANAYPSQLSGGQKQRVAIARALASNPHILLCDELTSALDPETTHAILNLLKKINTLYQITVVLITHDMEVVKHICHHIGLMEGGRLIEMLAIKTALQKTESQIRTLLYKQLSPTLPEYIQSVLSHVVNDKPLLRLLFQGEETSVPFISETSRALALNINILLANVDSFDTMACGVMVVTIEADEKKLKAFMARCKKAKIQVEILGYVS